MHKITLIYCQKKMGKQVPRHVTFSGPCASLSCAARCRPAIIQQITYSELLGKLCSGDSVARAPCLFRLYALQLNSNTDGRGECQSSQLRMMQESECIILNCASVCTYVYINGIHRNKIVEGNFGIQRNQLVNVPMV